MRNVWSTVLTKLCLLITYCCPCLGWDVEGAIPREPPRIVFSAFTSSPPKKCCGDSLSKQLFYNGPMLSVRKGPEAKCSYRPTVSCARRICPLFKFPTSWFEFQDSLTTHFDNLARTRPGARAIAICCESRTLQRRHERLRIGLSEESRKS